MCAGWNIWGVKVISVISKAVVKLYSALNLLIFLVYTSLYVWLLTYYASINAFYNIIYDTMHMDNDTQYISRFDVFGWPYCLYQKYQYWLIGSACIGCFEFQYYICDTQDIWYQGVCYLKPLFDTNQWARVILNFWLIASNEHMWMSQWICLL